MFHRFDPPQASLGLSLRWRGSLSLWPRPGFRKICSRICLRAQRAKLSEKYACVMLTRYSRPTSARNLPVCTTVHTYPIRVTHPPPTRGHIALSLSLVLADMLALQASADRALVVAEHEHRLDHVGQSRHLHVAERGSLRFAVVLPFRIVCIVLTD